MKRNPKILFIHPTGSPSAKNAALALQENRLLGKVITAFYIRKNNWFRKFLNIFPAQIKKRCFAELNRRIWEGVDDARLVRGNSPRELLRILLGRLKIFRLFGGLDYVLSNQIYLSLDQYAAGKFINKEMPGAVYAFEDACATSFATAKKHGILCLYDLPTFYYKKVRAIFSEEAMRFPQFSTELMIGREPDWKIERKEKEVRLSDYIFVASFATKKSLTDYGILPKKIIVIPYGAPVDYFRPSFRGHNKFRALFVGSVSPRKGVHYLLKAWKNLRFLHADLCLVGARQFSDKYLKQFDETVHFFSPIPHSLLEDQYRQASVFVFPSLVDGFGLVLLEAMACGIPVIATPNTGGPDIITDGVEGFIVPIRDEEALRQKLEWCYLHPEELAEMGRAARKKAEELSWDFYRKRLGNCIRGLFV